MNIQATKAAVTELASDAMVAGIFSDGVLGPMLSALDAAADGLVSHLVARKEITGKLAELTRLLSPPGLQTSELVVVGLGERSEFGQAQAVRAAGAAAKQLAARQRGTVVFCFDGDWDDATTSAAVCSTLAGCHGQDLYRSDRKLHVFRDVLWCGTSSRVVAEGVVLGECVNLVRRLVNEPPSVMTPERFAGEAVGLAATFGLEIDIWDEQRLEEERCGALLAVARGSAHPPRLVTLTHRGSDAADTPIALVGKGVTFDSGGYSLKPAEAMKNMKGDMAGAATVLGALVAAARLKLPVNIVGYMGLVENMLSGNAYMLGDVLTSRQGKTIEVLNTDAEGRLVLADVLDVAVSQGAGRLIDLATLTGACVVALGTDVAGLMTNDQAWCDEFLAAAQVCGEPVWQLPMFPEYAEQITSDVADIKNIGEGRWGGAIAGGKFLENFVGQRPWVHVDIAGPSFADKAKPWLDAGGTGCLLRSLIQLLRMRG
ncbi:MAG: leucyl aminopeptidase [Planctomycetaceae bacterium]|nr:leucyl aminopeptidase [Planctomycetaceae bacterium]